MSQKHKLYFAMIIFLGLIAALIMIGGLASANVQAVETASEENIDLGSIVLRERSMNLIVVAPVTSEGKTLGVIAIYDDPSTKRTEDYLEMYDSEGVLVALGWYDQFGIQRIAVDRAFLDGADRFQRTFVTVVDGEPI